MPPAAAMFAKARRHRDSLSSNPASRTPVSPLDQHFDLSRGADPQLHAGLHSPISLASADDRDRPSADSVRRLTGDGPRRSTVSLQPPVLPPIPRVASRNEGDAGLHSRREKEQGRRGDGELLRENNAAGAFSFGKQAAPFASDISRPASAVAAAPPVLAPLDIPSVTTTEPWPEIDFDKPKMEATMFPRPQPQAPGDPYTAGPPMSRSFVDSRDRPYSHNVQRPPAVASSYSSPNMLDSTPQVKAAQAPRSSPTPAASLDNVRNTPSATSTNYSGSTARPSIKSTKSASASASTLTQTIGTPYSETSAAFPAPQHVATRPKTMGSSSTVAGVMVPTHHTNSLHKDHSKPEKRKTRLLNPMALLVRRRSGQDAVAVPDEAERRAHAQAQARQQRVATAGINNIPEDFDPRIRGKIVHDFNAPRPRRTVSSNDAGFRRSVDQQMHSHDSMPAMPSMSGQEQQQRQSTHSTQPSDVSSRHSRHTPIFIEHLYDEPGQSAPEHSIQAERLENKDFLKRASHQSNSGHEGAFLPPFARRSQQLDPMQASFYHDDDSDKRSSNQSNLAQRESTASSGVPVSPIVVGMNNNQADGQHKKPRPVSDMSMLGGRFDAPTSHPTTFYNGDRDSRLTTHTQSPSVSTMNENASPSQGPSRPQSQSPPTKAIHPALRNIISGPNSPKPAFPDHTSAHSSPAFNSSAASTPEPAVADAAVTLQPPNTPPRLVEKRASAVGHTKPAASLTPKHAASNASRFSFQLDASAAEEKALEEKHRRMASGTHQRKQSVTEQDEDDDDYFDEGAMDDEDEMEAEMRMHDNAQFQHQPKIHVAQSDTSSVYDEDAPHARRDPEQTYAEHPAFRGHSAVYSSKHDSMAPSSRYSSDASVYASNGWNPQHSRFMSDSTMMTVGDREGNGQGMPRNDFYMQPQAAAFGIGAPGETAGGRIPNRDSVMTVSTVHSNGAHQMSQPGNNAVPAPSNMQHPNFSGFKFSDSPERSRPATSDSPRQPAFTAIGQHPAEYYNQLPLPSEPAPSAQPSKMSQAQSTNEPAESAAYHGSIGQGIRARNASMNQNLQYAASESSADTHDDMYFDDGGFSAEVQNSSGYGESINEEELDDPDFAGGYRGMEPRGYHERHASAMTITGRDGPYPTFAMPNPAKAAQRESQMLLEDLPLHGRVEPQWIPQRNPSDDAKRLGLSDRVPPLPAQPGAPDNMPQMAAYHQALADAANRAAEDGRFERQGSVSTAKSSVYPGEEQQARRDGQDEAADDKSRYSQDEAGNAFENNSSSAAPENVNPNPTDSHNVNNARFSQASAAYTMPRMSGFDFGFNASSLPSDDPNAAPTDDFNAAHLDDDAYDPDEEAFIAAANADALAHDSAGYYGQEFGFYARARSDSAGSGPGSHGKHAQLPPLEAINGGFFGADGEDPLKRQKSGREPDLTPITERSEFSARNSFINFGPASAASWGVGSPALARLPLSPLVGDAAAAAQGHKSRASGGGYFGVFPPPASAGLVEGRPWMSAESPVSVNSNASSAREREGDPTPRKGAQAPVGGEGAGRGAGNGNGNGNGWI